MPRPIPLHLLNQIFTIQEFTVATDSQGGHARTAVNKVTNVRGRIRPLTAPERIIGNREGAEVTHRIYFLPDTDVLRGDQVLLGSDAYLVIYPRQPSELGHHIEVDVRHTVHSA